MSLLLLLKGQAAPSGSGAGTVDGVGALQGGGSAPVNGGGNVDGIGSLVGAGARVSAGSGNVDGLGSLVGEGGAPASVPSGGGSVGGTGVLVGAGAETQAGKIGGDDAFRVEIYEPKKAKRKAKRLKTRLEVLREEVPEAVENISIPPTPVKAIDWASYAVQLEAIEGILKELQYQLAEQDDEEILMLIL